MSQEIEARRMARDLLIESRGASDHPQTILDAGYRAAVTRLWEPLLEGIQQPYTKALVGQLLENTRRHLQSLTEETRSLNVGEFTKFIFPIIRRVWANLISNNLVSVQPMTAPVGAVFFFEYKYGTSKGPIAAGTNLIESFDPNYSSDFIGNEVLLLGYATGAGFPTPGGIALDFRPAIPKTVTVNLLDNATKAIVATISDVLGDGNLTGTAGVTGTVNYTTGEVFITAFAGAPASIDALASYRYNMEMNPDIPQVNLDISFSEVRAKTRKLKALWSPESADDLRSFHGIDIETELVAGIASNMALEIDREILGDLLNAAETSGAVVGEPVNTFNTVAPAGIRDVDHIRSIITNISTISALIQKRTLRGFANWIVCGPEASSLILQLETTRDFRSMFSTDGAPLNSPPAQIGNQYGMYQLGVLGNRWTVYVDPYFPSDKILIGLKGQSFLDAGYTYAPYIPLQVTPTLFDPGDQSFRKGLRTRYATKLINPKFYAVLKLVKS
jgi:hypothetical protein